MRTPHIVSLVIVLLSFGIGVYLYPYMPESMASHWNANGIVDGHMSRFWGLFLMPVIMLALFLLFALIPRIDPKKSNIRKFRKYYETFVVMVMAFMLYIYLLTIFWNIGAEFSMIAFLCPAFAILFYYCGILLGKAERNWFIGIRTPWTMSSDRVWKKTHKAGSRLFRICGIVALLGILFPEYAIMLVIGPVILAVVCLFVYSYVEYSRR